MEKIEKTDEVKETLEMNVNVSYSNTVNFERYNRDCTNVMGNEKAVRFTKIVENAMFNSILTMVERYESEPPVHYIWSGIKKGTFGYVYGPAKSGKTILCENLGMSIAAKMPEFLGMEINSYGIESVLFISMEEFWQNRTDRNKKQLTLIDINDREKFNYNVVNEMFPLSMDNEKSWQDLQSVIVDSKADFVIIDSLTRLTSDEVEKSKVGSDISRRLKSLTYDLNITMLVVHHSSKITDTSLDLAHLAGSRVVGQEADFILGVNRLSNGRRYFKEVATRYKQENELVTPFVIDDNLWLNGQASVEETQVFGAVDHRENPSNERMVFGSVKRLSKKSGEIKTSEVLADLEGKIGKTVIYEYLGNLDEKQKIDRSKNGYLKLL